MIEPVIGIIGGSGLYDIEGLENKMWRHVTTPWGEPSDALLFGRLAGRASALTHASQLSG
jgi:5'-methylthioadenosine phosphorylase